MKLIDNWINKNLICNKCGSHKSVKYEGNDGKNYCNRCIAVVDMGLENVSILTKQEHKKIT
jgi:hypothetical protein